MPAYPASKRLESLRQQVRMPDGREKGSHHGREKEVFSNVQAAGNRAAIERELDPGPTQPCLDIQQCSGQTAPPPKPYEGEMAIAVADNLFSKPFTNRFQLYPPSVDLNNLLRSYINTDLS